MKKYIILGILSLLISFPVFAEITQYRNYNSRAVCRDGSYSTSTGRGTCSHHGGVSYYL